MAVLPAIFTQRSGRWLIKLAETALVLVLRLSGAALVLLLAIFGGTAAWELWQRLWALPSEKQFTVVFAILIALLVWRIVFKGLRRRIECIWTRREIASPTGEPTPIPGKFFPPARLREIARHEAAHVVVAHRLGYTVQRTWLHHQGGTTTYKRAAEGSASDHLYGYAAVALAGNLSDHAAGIHHEGSDDDWAQILRVELQIISLNERPDQHDGPLDFQSLTESLSATVHTILNQDGQLIETIARELQEKTHLGKDQIHGLLQSESAAELRGTQPGLRR